MKRIALVTLALIATPAFAEEQVPAKVVTCQACHGERGAKPTADMYPVLAGQYRNYLEHALSEYKEGKRKNAIMGAQAAQLSKEDIKELAHYFASQQGPLYTPSVHGGAAHQ